MNDAPVISDLTSATVVEGVPGETVTSEMSLGLWPLLIPIPARKSRDVVT